MSDTISTLDDLSMDIVNENVLIDKDELDREVEDSKTSVVLDSRRRLERCLEDRQLAKDLQEFDFEF